MNKKNKSSKKLALKTLTVADLRQIGGAGAEADGKAEMECKTGDTKYCKPKEF